MIKETMTYLDCNNNERTEAFFFNLSKAEVIEMEYSTSGGLAEQIQKIMETQDTPSIIKIFKDIILRSYGEKSPDGRRFIKSEELSRSFSETEAYSQLFMRMLNDAEFAAKFINGILPAEAVKELKLADNKAETGVLRSAT